jgi:hypothetical protein
MSSMPAADGGRRVGILLTGPLKRGVAGGPGPTGTICLLDVPRGLFVAGILARASVLCALGRALRK